MKNCDRRLATGLVLATMGRPTGGSMTLEQKALSVTGAAIAIIAINTAVAWLFTPIGDGLTRVDCMAGIKQACAQLEENQ